MAPINVAEHLVRMAREYPDRPALHLPQGAVRRTGATPHRSITFAELNADADRIAHGLAGAGIGRGVRTALMVPPGADFFALTFALLKVAAIPVLIDPGMGVKNLGKCLGQAKPLGFIGIGKAHLARRLLGWAKETVRITVNVGSWSWGCGYSLNRIRRLGEGKGPYPVPQVARDDPSAILFTSGSTGVAKGAEYTHGIFAAQVEALKATYGIQPGEVDLCTFPLFALFGPALGMTSVVPDMDASRPATMDPWRAAAQMKQFGITNLFASPAVLRRLAELPDTEKPAFARLNRVLSAGAPATAAVLEKVSRLLPAGVEIFTPYGATEALPVANIGSREILGETRRLTDAGKGVCIGRPVAGVQVEVIPISDTPIADWRDVTVLPSDEVGEFVVRGPAVTKRYFELPEATAQAKILDTATGETLHRMGDVGYRDSSGRLWFCGRKSHRVTTPEGTLFTDMVEPIFNTVPGIFRTALVGVRRGDTTYPVLCVELDRSRVYSAILQDLNRLAFANPLLKGIQAFLPHPRFPVDVRHNSKIFREKLAIWADAQLGPQWAGGPA